MTVLAFDIETRRLTGEVEEQYAEPHAHRPKILRGLPRRGTLGLSNIPREPREGIAQETSA